MFSRRTDWRLEPNRLERARRMREAAGGPILDLTESNPTRCGLGPDPETLRREFNRPEIARYAPEPFGPEAARRAVAEGFDLAVRGADETRIVLTCSTSESYSILFRLLADPGDRILAPAPSYPLVPYLARLDHLELDSYPLVPEERFRIDLDALEAAIGPRTRAVLVVHPGNPTGAWVRRDEAERLEALCRRRRLALIADEVFSPFPFGDNPRRLPTWAGRAGTLTFSLNGLSKSVGLPQLKVAWIAVSGPAGQVETALGRLEVICDTYLSVNTPALIALPGLLRKKDRVVAAILDRVRGNRKVLEDRLAPAGAGRVLPSEGGWYAVVEVPRVRTEEDWCLHLLETCGILVHPGYFFDFPRAGYLVVSLLPPPDRFRDGAGRLAGAIGAA